jgi:hypothetical protein
LQSLASFSSSLSPLLFASSESLNSKSFSDGALALLCKTPSRRQCCLLLNCMGWPVIGNECEIENLVQEKILRCTIPEVLVGRGSTPSFFFHLQ